jgi:uncharacterized membrane protein YczE
MKKRILFVIIGNIILGFGTAILNLSGFGIDPFTSMNTGLAAVLHIGLGITQACVNLILLIPVIRYMRSGFGAGALINMFGLGFIVQYWGVLFGHFGITAASFADNIPLRLLLFVIGILINNFGIALYMECNLGCGPYDALGDLIAEKTHGKIPFNTARILLDATSAVIGLICGLIMHITTTGIVTVFIALGTGPIVAFFRVHAARKILGPVGSGD